MRIPMSTEEEATVETIRQPDVSYNRSACVDRVVNGRQMRGCGAVVAWVKLGTGRRMPIDLDPAADGNVKLTGAGHAFILGKRAIEEDTGPRYVSHFRSCPHAEQWRRPT